MIENMVERLSRGIDYFNREYFFEAHDEIEELWMDARHKEHRDLFHGLVNMATGFYHYRMNNFKGMRSQLMKGFGKLSELPPVCVGCNLSKLLDDSWPFLQALESGTKNFPEKLPVIEFHPEVLSV
jgi:hypothetical protein